MQSDVARDMTPRYPCGDVFAMRYPVRMPLLGFASRPAPASKYKKRVMEFRDEGEELFLGD